MDDKNLGDFPFIVIKDKLITEVSKQFEAMTGYVYSEFLNKNIVDVFVNLRVGPNVDIESIDEKTDYFLFTKSLKVRFFNIKVEYIEQEKIYFFLEIPNSEMDIKFPFVMAMCTDNYYGIGIFSIPDSTLLKANDKYISFMDKPFSRMENCIGRHIWEFTTGFKGSTYEEIWKDVINTGKVYNLDEYMYEGLNRGITYWRISLLPVFDDNDMKYCLAITSEITEQVLHRRKLEEQAQVIKEQNYKLKYQADLLDLSEEAIFAWKLNGGIVYWNRGAEQMYGYSANEAIGNISHNLLKTVHYENFDKIKLTILKDKMWKGEIEHTRKDGKKLIIETSHQIITDEHGQNIILETNRDITERKKLQDGVKNQKKELEEIIQNIDDAIFIYDANKNYYLTNNSAKEYFKGIELKTFGDDYDHFKYYDLEGKEIPLEDMTISKVFRGEVINNHRITLKNSNITKHISVNGRPVYDNTGNIKFAILCSRDITHDLETQIRIEDQNKKLEAIINNISEELYIVDKDRNYIMLNNAARERYVSNKFMNSSEYMNKNKLFDLSQKEIDFNNTPIARLTSGEYIKEETVIVYDPDKRYVCSNGKPIFDKHGNFMVGVMLTRDITKRILQEQEIRYQKDQLETIIENMSDAIIVFDSKGKVILLNNEARKMYQHLTSKSLTEVQSDYEYFDLDGNLIKSEKFGTTRAFKGEKVRSETVVVKGPDKYKIIEMNASPIFNDRKNVVSVVLSYRDITEEVEQQQQLLTAEREKREAMEKAIEMKDEFLSMISHEFRTPINVISTAIQAINYICANDLTEQLRKYLNTIRQNTFRQLRLVNNLLDITRLNADRIKINKTNRDIVFLTSSIVESVYTYSLQKGVILTFSSLVNKKIIGIDDEKYERILLNLLSNAIKFTPKGKSITVKLRTVKNNISVEVKDMGIGIPEDKINVIFERFGQADSVLSRQAEGAGIGLSLVKKFVEALGGSISVKSKIGKGSTFSILLPSEKIIEEKDAPQLTDLMNNRLVEITNVEFSDIYL